MKIYVWKWRESREYIEFSTSSRNLFFWPPPSNQNPLFSRSAYKERTTEVSEEGGKDLRERRGPWHLRTPQKMEKHFQLLVDVPFRSHRLVIWNSYANEMSTLWGRHIKKCLSVHTLYLQPHGHEVACLWTPSAAITGSEEQLRKQHMNKDAIKSLFLLEQQISTTAVQTWK